MKKMKNFTVISGLAFAFVLVMFTFQSSNANPVTDQSAVVSTNMGVVNGHINMLDGKCGEGTTKAEKKTGTKTKASEGKCGEGKCGTGTAKAEKKTGAKAKTETKAKTSEGKCGEGKCGTATSKTEKSSSKKAKTSEGKCGEGKCGVA